MGQGFDKGAKFVEKFLLDKLAGICYPRGADKVIGTIAKGCVEMPEVELHVVRSRLRPLLLQAIEQHIDCGKKGLTLNEY